MRLTPPPFVPDKVALINLGCPKNLVDAEVMLGHLAARGFELTTHVEEADAVVVNTCGFLRQSSQESIDTLLATAARKGSGGPRAVVAAGCLVQRHGAELGNSLPEVDGFLGVGQAAALPDLVRQVLDGKRVSLLNGPSAGFESYGLRLHSQGPTAYVKLSEGCNRKCAFCVIPQIRGPMVSRSRSTILAEARALTARGVRELVLVGQDPVLYGSDNREGGLVPLLEELCEIPSLRWIRVMYLFPDRRAVQVLSAIARLPRMAPYVDMPFQHVAPGVLRSMNRPGSAGEFLELLARFREECPQGFVRSTFIVGHPGESEADFQQLLDFLARARLDWVGAFRYSREEGSAAADLPHQLRPAEKRRRYRELMQLQQRLSREALRRRLGDETEVLLEAASGGGFVGRSAGQAPEIDGRTLVRPGSVPGLRPGDIIRARITGSSVYDLRATALERLVPGQPVLPQLVQLNPTCSTGFQAE